MRCLVFPGQGVQRRGMGAELFDLFPEEVEAADAVLGYSVRELCVHDPEGRLGDTRYAQPAVFLVNALDARRRLAGEGAGAEPVACYAGHSLGEYNALVAAGCLDLLDALRLVRARAEAMAAVRGGAMAAVAGIGADEVASALRRGRVRGVYVANRNSDRQTVVAGGRDEVTGATGVLREAGARAVVPLPVSGPFHTPLMAPAARAFAAALEGRTFRSPAVPVFSGVTAAAFDPARAAALLTAQITAPVEWVRTVRALRAAGVTRFDEANGTTLTSLLPAIA
ncbi:ACP S-malonyltransferase [Kitasatospora phosalacinea]|uniref:ACP S-malonyltransferase n=1 Tax=Kitasatospora phosalacinea TaxID=2065 RepID=UPI0005253C74|nr:ACP S-malonyltransferase [Kitasatospora phosalacinea]